MSIFNKLNLCGLPHGDQRLLALSVEVFNTVYNAVFSERAAKLVEQQERERALQQQQQAAASPRAGTPAGSLMGVVPPPSSMGMLNQAMPPMPGNAKSPVYPLHETIKMQHPGTLHHLLTPSIPQLIFISHQSLYFYPPQDPIWFYLYTQL